MIDFGAGFASRTLKKAPFSMVPFYLVSVETKLRYTNTNAITNAMTIITMPTIKAVIS